jgi:hypothetical protein
MPSPSQERDERAPDVVGRGGVLLLATLAAAAAVACGSDAAVTSTSPSQTKCQVTLAAPSSTIGAGGGPGSVSVTTSPECPWDVSAGVNWVSGLAPTSGQGNGTVSFQVAPNPMPSVREGDIIVNDARMRVSQQAAACQFAVQPDSLAVAAAGGAEQVAVATASGCSWTAATEVGWIDFSTPVTGTGDGAVGISIATNPGLAPRAGTIVVGGQRVAVTQAGTVSTSCSYTISVTSTVSIDANGGPGTVAVATMPACAWTASSSVPWLTVTAGASGTGAGAVAFTVAPNPGSARTGIVTIAGHTVTVTQAAAAATPCTYTLGQPDASIAAGGGTGSVAVSTASGCGWTASSTVPWITVTAGASGSGNGAVAFTVAQNTGAARSGTILAAGQTFTVNQAAAPPAPCTYSISPPDAAMPAAGGSGAIAVSAASGCSWTANSTAPWLSVTSGASGSGNGSVAFTVAANPGSARSGTITVAGQTFTVNQAAAPPPCTYSITPTSASIAVLGGTGSVAVSAAAGCTWTAASNAQWITVTSGANGTGNGAVGFSVAANIGASRTGTITIAGQTFTVAQAALLCTYAITPTSLNTSKDGGDYSVAVTAGNGCAWTARSNDGWIDLRSGSSGSGNGTVSIRIKDHKGKNDRTGTMTIAGHTFTVIQRGDD